MPETFADILGKRLHAEHRPMLLARALPRSEVAVTEVRSDQPTYARSDPLPFDAAFVAALQLRDFPRHEWWEDGRQAPVTPLRAGQLTLYSLERDPRFTINHAFHSIHIRLSRVVLTDMASELGAKWDGELTYASGIGLDDPVLRDLISLLRPALMQPEWAGRLFIDGVTAAIALHVATTYGAPRLSRMRAFGRLSPVQQLRAFELIDARINGDLSVTELAGYCGLSGSRFAHAFKNTTGVTPHRWLTRRRVDRAQMLIRARAEMPLSQIALECGFADQSHFTHVFTAVVGAAPGEWRRQTGAI